MGEGEKLTWEGKEMGKVDEGEFVGEFRGAQERRN